MDLIHSYIYTAQPVPAAPPADKFFHRHRRGLGIMLSLIVHFSIFAWILYRGIFAPFTQMAIVDEAYNEVKWLEIAKLAKPLKYPSQLLPQPGRVVPLDELERRRKEEEQKAKTRKKKEIKKQKAAEKEDEAAKTENEPSPEPAQPEQPAAPPRFGFINARPIREIVGKVYTVYKNGGLDINNTVFSLTLGFEVKQDGSLDNVTILKSSGSQQIDTAALNIAAAISESHALMPLAALSSTTATLDLNAETALLKISGFAVTTPQAEDLATAFSQQLTGLRLLMSLRNQDAATLLSHLEVSNQANQLVAKLSMSRADASMMMRKNFGHAAPAEPDKQPEVSGKNLMYDFSMGSTIF